MLHELSHNVFGPHDAKFHALWDQLRDEYEGLVRKGYTGEGFLSEGKRLGGRQVPLDEARRIARNAAEKRRTLYSGSGQKLGGAPVRAGTDIRKVIVDAIDRRATVMRGCASDNKNEKEIKAMADQATNNGFRTKAEEDKANEQAISQALWELVQEEKKQEYGDSYIPPTAENPTGNGGGDLKQPYSETLRDSKASKPVSAIAKKPAHSRPDSQNRPISRLVQPPPKKVALSTSSQLPPKSQKSAAGSSPQASVIVKPSEWECNICTLHNPISFLCCDACGSERPAEVTRKLAASSTRPLQSPAAKSSTWTCHMCSTIMDNQWWTCSTCSALKLSS